jgi:endonuclease/exonuclease/phosphatase family metal-dependent hydrolase
LGTYAPRGHGCGKSDKPQRFSTAILVRGLIREEIHLSSSHDWVNDELRRFAGNLVAAKIALDSGERFRVMCVYVPPWPIDRARLKEFDVSQVKLKNNRDVWVTELMWAALDNVQRDGMPWVVAGDLNSSITFDTLWRDGPRGNQEVQDRMSALGFVECLRSAQGRLTPTFENPKDGKVIHQMDHLFLPQRLVSRLATCRAGDPEVVFGESLSDHLPIIADLVPEALPPDSPSSHA